MTIAADFDRLDALQGKLLESRNGLPKAEGQELDRLAHELGVLKNLEESPQGVGAPCR